MKKLIYPILMSTTLLLASCESLVEGINDNPNSLTIDAVDAGYYLNGAELSNIAIQLGPLNRMAGYYSGQLLGLEQLERNRYRYEITNTDFSWDGYASVVNPLRHIRSSKPGHRLYQGISRVLEANLIGTYASLFGDVPFTETISDIRHPRFESQVNVFKGIDQLLDQAIADLDQAQGVVVLQDYVFNGNRQKWLQTAWTLKARYLLLTKQYEAAYAAALNGISLPANSFKFVPLNIANEQSVKNKLYISLRLGPWIGSNDSHLANLLKSESGISRNNSKTNEARRWAYYNINPNNADGNLGIANDLEAQPIVTFEENLLILAEAGTRTKGLETGLTHLNDLRKHLQSGAFFNGRYATTAFKYENYLAADFVSGAELNKEGLQPVRALLKEIILERYITGFTTFIPYDDHRRLVSENADDIRVKFPLNTVTATRNIERFLYPEVEATTNLNAKPDPGAFVSDEIFRK